MPPAASSFKCEWQRAPVVSAFRCWLKTFPAPGRFAPPADIPAPIVAFLAGRADLAGLTLERYPVGTRVRHRNEIRALLATAYRGTALSIP